MKTRMVTLIFIATIMGIFVEQAAAQTVITSVTRRNSTQTPPALGGILQDKSLSMVDRTHVYRNIPAYLLGIAEYVKQDNDDRTAATYEVDVVLAVRADVYLFLDYRIGDNSNANPPALSATVMPWVAEMGFVDTGEKLDLDESNDGSINQYFRIYKAQFPAGTITLKQQNSGTINMYGIAAIMVDPTFNPAPVATAAPKYAKIYPGGSVQLNGTITDEPPLEGDPGVLSWYWKKKAGPGTVTFAPSATAEDPIATFDTKGMYTLLLQATDGTKDANDVITVYVADRADEKLIGYWDMEQNVIDQSFNNNDGILKGTAAYDTDKAVGDFSMNLTMTNPSDPNTYPYVYLGDAPELDFGYPSEFSVAAWVKTTSTEQSNIFNKGGDEDGGIRYMLSVGETDAPRGRAEFIMDDNVNKVVNTGTAFVNDGKWHFVVAVKDLVSTRIFVDGIQTGSASLPANYDLSGTNQTGAYIGIGILSPTDADRARPTDPFDVSKAGAPQKDLNGRVDDVRVYNYALALDDPGFTSVRSLAAMGPIAATVNAGPDGSFLIKPGLSYQLAGVVTDYGKPDGKTILWTTASGPGGAEAAFADPSSPTSTVTFPVAGAYTLKLTVIDDVGTVEDTVVITTTTPTCADVVAAGLTQKTDLNKDCYVNLKDLAILLENWTQCNDPEDEDCIWPF